MSNEIEFAEKYQPLFELLNGEHSEVDTVICTGGRYSLKSHTVSIFSITALTWYAWNILYTRYTNSTIVDSVKPEVSDKIEMLGLTSALKDTESHIEYKCNRIAFKGIKPGAKAQTANLKSLSGFNCFICDEAEELPDYATFKKIFYSIRDNEKRNLSILILNPTIELHWIFEEFFEKKGVSSGWNGIKDNVMYIHTSYLDATQALIPKNILADYERLKIEDPEEYNNVILGGWIKAYPTAIFKNIDYIPKFPDGLGYHFGLDFGFTTDETALVKYTETSTDIYFELLLYQPTETPEEIDEYCQSISLDDVYFIPTTADSSDRYVSERKGVIKMVQGLKALGWQVSKVSKTKNIIFWLNSMKRKRIHVVDNHLAKYVKSEQKYYRMKEINGIAINQPIDGHDHAFSAARYAHMSEHSGSANFDVKTE